MCDKNFGESIAKNINGLGKNVEVRGIEFVAHAFEITWIFKFDLLMTPNVTPSRRRCPGFDTAAYAFSKVAERCSNRADDGAEKQEFFRGGSPPGGFLRRPHRGFHGCSYNLEKFSNFGRCHRAVP
jgi:hypothetical protein